MSVEWILTFLWMIECPNIRKIMEINADIAAMMTLYSRS